MRFVALNLCLIPLKPRSKEPDVPWVRYQDCRPTEDDIRTWFGNGFRRNAGIVLGRVSSIVVIESDTPEAETWCATHLPHTPMMTRSARGIHRYYRRPPDVATIPAHIHTP